MKTHNAPKIGKLKKLLSFIFLFAFALSVKGQLILDGNFESVTAHAEVINKYSNSTYSYLWNANTMFPQYWLQPTDGSCDIYSDFSDNNGHGPCYDPTFPVNAGCFPSVCNYNLCM